MKRTANKPRMSEHQLQATIIQQCNLRALANPLWGLIFAIPNGGDRDVRVAVKLQAEGVKAGIPDLFVPVARHGWHGLFMELKAKGNKPKTHQEQWLQLLANQGYCCCVITDDLDEAMRILHWYIEGKEE